MEVSPNPAVFAVPAAGAAQPLAARPHLAFIDGLRGLAALFVVVHHVYVHLGAFQLTAVGRAFGILAHGHYAVVLFIVISGYCLALPTLAGGMRLRTSVGGFFARRAWRILPPYYAALLMSLVLLRFGGLSEMTGTHWDNSLDVYRRDVLMHVVLLHDFFRPYRINHTFWSIAVELHIYVIFPLILLPLARRVGGVGASAVVAAVVIGLDAAFPMWERPVAWHFVAPFVFGVTAAALAMGPGVTGLQARARGMAPAVAVVATLALVVCVAVLPPVGQVRMDLLAGLASAAVLLGLGTASGSDGPRITGSRISGSRITGPLIVHLRRLLEARWLVLLGLFSYSLYLTHAPLIQVAWLYLVRPMGLSVGVSTLLLMGLVPVLVAAAYGFYLVFERPFVGRMPTIPAVLLRLRRGVGGRAGEGEGVGR